MPISPNWCKALTAMNKWFRLANYCWMFNEGMFLHHSIVAAFRQMRRVKYYYLFGWGTPVLVMVPYIAVHSMQRYDELCWNNSMKYLEYIYTIPPLIMICVSLFAYHSWRSPLRRFASNQVNAILLANVIRVLMTKLRSSPDHFRAGLRASLILLPIFGVQYLFYVVAVDPYQSCNNGLFAIRYLEIAVEALQGAIVTTIFCFINGEV